MDAIERIAATRKDFEVALQKFQRKDKRRTRRARTIRTRPKDAARDLQKKLTEMEKRLWVSPDIKGIIDDRSLIAEVDAAGFPVFSTFEPRAPRPRGPEDLRRLQQAVREGCGGVPQAGGEVED